MKKILAFLALALFITTNAYAIKYINGYQRKDGTYVGGHFRSDPDGYTWNNLNP